MKNENHFGTLTERMQAFREEVLDEKPYVDAERAIWATEAYRELSLIHIYLRIIPPQLPFPLLHLLFQFLISGHIYPVSYTHLIPI